MSVMVTMYDYELMPQTRWCGCSTTLPPNPRIGDLYFNPDTDGWQTFTNEGWEMLCAAAEEVPAAVEPYRCEWCGRLHLNLYESCPGCGGPR